MKQIKVTFWISTNYVGSEYRETLEFEVPDGLSDDELDDYIRPIYEEWAWEVLDSGWEIEN